MPAEGPRRPQLLAWVGPRHLLVAIAAALAVGLAIGIPTDVVPNPWFRRMTPVRPEDYVFLALTALLTGALAATYLAPSARGAAGGRGAGAGLGGGFLALLAVGCPVCNKLVVTLVGLSGATTYFAPIQPLLGAAAVLLAAAALTVRVRRLAEPCPLPRASEATGGLPG